MSNYSSCSLSITRVLKFCIAAFTDDERMSSNLVYDLDILWLRQAFICYIDTLSLIEFDVAAFPVLKLGCLLYLLLLSIYLITVVYLIVLMSFKCNIWNGSSIYTWWRWAIELGVLGVSCDRAAASRSRNGVRRAASTTRHLKRYLMVCNGAEKG